MTLRYLVPSLLAVAVGGTGYALDGQSAVPPPNVDVAQQTMNIETSDKPLEIVLQWISRRAGVNIVCNEAEQPRVTLRLANVTWQEAIEQIANRYDLVIEKKSERIWQLSRPPKVRMEFQDARLTVVLEALARQANVNIVISDDINASRRLTMTLNGVPWREALDVIVKATGYTWIEQDYKIIRIVSKENVQKDLQTRVYRLDYASGDKVKDSIAVALSADGKAVYDHRTNSLVLTDTPPNLEAAAKILQRLDTRTREVLIEMKFVDFSESDARRIGFDPISLGFDLAGFGRIAATYSPFAANGGISSVGGYRVSPSGSGNINPLLGPTGPIPNSTGALSGAFTFEAIANLTTTEVMQTPQLLTLDNTKATILIGREIRFAESTVTQESGTTVTTLKEAASSPVKDGVTIDVTPHITSDGFVSIELVAKDENATLRTFSAGSGPTALTIELPQKDLTNLTTTIMVADGQTAVIGGILRNKVVEDDRHIPGLSTIPVLGWLFKKQEDTLEKRNLTIFITPRVIPNHDKDETEEASIRLREKISGLPQKATATTAAESRTLSE